MAARQNRRQHYADELVTGPTQERLVQAQKEGGTEEWVGTDANGHKAKASRCIDTIGRLVTSGMVSGATASAGRRFAVTFRRAAFQDLRASSFTRVLANGDPSEASLDRIEDARREVDAIIKTLGGHGSPAGEAAWWVLGVGLTLGDWATRMRMGSGRSLNPMAAQGVVLGTLGMLAAYYEERHRRGEMDKFRLGDNSNI